MRLIFLGSGEFGLPTLQHLHAQGLVATVVTQPDRPAGRHRHLTPTPIGQWAQSAALRLIKAPDVNTPAIIDQLRAVGADAAVVIAFGQKLGPDLIAALGAVAINLHASLLPRYRGAAPINWAIIQGESVTGISVIGLAQRMDAGLIYAQASTPIGPTETAGELHDRLATMGPQLVSGVLTDFQAGRLQGQPQDETQATRAPELARQDGWLDFAADPRLVVARLHGLTPWPGVTVQWEPSIPGETSAAPARALILRRAAVWTGPLPAHSGGAAPPPGTILDNHLVATGQPAASESSSPAPTPAPGAIELLELQVPGGRPMSMAQFVRGHPWRAGGRLLSALGGKQASS